ncbi:cell division protein FtsK [Amycolatopsis acidicola]|uniref:Cell division protein FtsK n=1 Tax=Amycolatopsis acidicola TaxID=2596893 RepID=A0A5N0VBG2_9PSEU|nr:cell division protein FtsK [Amycolatopsis acidicola]
MNAAARVVVAVVRSPFRFLAAAARGTAMMLRVWRKWVRVQDYREAAEQSEKLADKYTEIRELTLFRWKVTAGSVISLVGLVLVTAWIFGHVAVAVAAGLVALAFAVAGRRREGGPGRKALLAGPRVLMWTMDPQVLVEAFRDAKLIGKDETLRLVERVTRSHGGWAMTIDLPATRKAADVIRNREALASALAVDEIQLIVERVRGTGGHAGRVAVWVADKDPYSGPPRKTPLLAAKRWDAWKPVPFGHDARRRRVDLPLVWTSLLIGAIPRQGKTMAMRLAAAGLILDPCTRLYLFDGKGGKDWKAAESIAHRFVCGDTAEDIQAVRDHLTALVAEVQDRYTRMSELDDEVCPESKITPALSRDPSMTMPITAVILDEVQLFLENPDHGEYIVDLLAYLARKGPAAGIVVILATQRPDSQTIPSRLRSVLGSRFALRVMDWRDSNIVLGEQMNTRGYDASTLLPTHKGVGILRPDGETGSDAPATIVRTDYMANPEWQDICTRGRLLREQEGTLSGHAAGDDGPVVDAAAVVDALDVGSGLPEPLASVVRHLGDALRQREFVPTAELVEALDLDPTSFGRQMGELGCRPVRQYVPATAGESRRVRGYLTADIRAAVENCE